MDETYRQPQIGYAREPRYHPKAKQTVRSTLLETQVKSALRWANEKQLPVTCIMLEPLNPDHAPEVRSELELLLGSTNHRETSDRILYQGNCTLAIVQTNLEYADQLFGGLQTFLKGDPFVLKKIAEQLPADDYWHKRINAYLASGTQREPVILAGYPQEYCPPASEMPTQAKPRRFETIMRALLGVKEHPSGQPSCAAVPEDFYETLVMGFENCKNALKDPDAELTRRSNSSQPASSRDLSPVA